MESGVTSAHLHIIIEALEQLKSDYLQLFMDRDLDLKFVEDKDQVVKEICYHLSMEISSPLIVGTPSSLEIVTLEGVCATHTERGEHS